MQTSPPQPDLFTVAVAAPGRAAGSPAPPPGAAVRLRVLIQQPALPHYRVPVFRALAGRMGIKFRLLYGVTPGGPPNVDPDGFDAELVPIHRLGAGLFWHPAQWRAVRRGASDVSILLWDVHYLSLVPALLRARLAGVKTVLWGHGYSKREASWRSFARRTVARLADGLLFYNHTTARRFVEQWGWDPQRVHVALNSLDQNPIQEARAFWSEHPVRLKAFRREQGLRDRPVVLFVSRLSRDNRVDLLIEAAALLRDAVPDLLIVIIGIGEDRDRLVTLTHYLGVADRVRFLGAIYDEEQLGAWFCSASVFCYPANIGLSLLHAFGYGVPVITSDRIEAQNPEIEALRPGVNGLLYADGDVGDLAATLRRVIEDAPLRAALSAGADRTVSERFTIDRMVDGIEGAVRAAAGGPIAARTSPCAAASAAPAPAAVACVPVAAAKPVVQRPINLAIVANAHTPYRAHLHRRIVREMAGEVRLWSLYTHEMSNAPWAFTVPAEIRPVLFGAGEVAERQERPSNLLHEWRKGRRIIGWMKEHAIDVVLLNGYNDAARLRILRWCRARRIPVFLWGDSNIKGDAGGRSFRARFKRRIVPWVIRQCAAVLPCGVRGKEYFARYGATEDKMFLFPLEPDYELVRNPPPERVDAVAERYRLRPGRRRIVFSGRLVGLKRVDLLVDAFARVADLRPGWDLVIIGDGPLRGALEARIPDALRGRVSWTGFFPNQKDVSAVYRLSDVLVLPSDYEAWSLVVIEAAAAGLAIVTSDVVGAAPEMVHDGVNGRTFPPGNLDRLVAALIEVTDPANTDRMKAASSGVLERWRRAADPVEGLRRAIAKARQ